MINKKSIIPFSLISLLYASNTIDLGTVEVEAVNRVSETYTTTYSNIDTNSTLNNQKQTDITANVTVITSKEIEQKGYTTILDAIGRISGFATSSNGGMGQTSGIYLRGFGSGDILIMIDGIPIKDPTNPSFSASLSNILLDDVDHIEVVKGSQSGVWGADAAAGVINIVTKNGSYNGVKLRAGYGTYNTKSGGMSISANGEAGSLYISGEHYKTDGFSALKPRYKESDGYTNDTLNIKGKLNITKNSSFGILYNQIDSDFDYDSKSAEDDLSNGTYSQKLTGFNYDLKEQKVDFSMRVSTNKIDRSMHDASWGDSTYSGQSAKGSILARYHISDTQSITLGSDYTKYKAKDSFSSESSYNNRALYGIYKGVVEDFLGARTVVNAALRYDEFSIFENKTTYRVGIKRDCNMIEGLFTSANVYSAYKAPSLYQYSTNSSIKPESTDGFEVSAGYKEYIKLTYFKNTIKDRIDYDYNSWSYFNSGSDYSVDGIEAESSYSFDKLSTVLTLNYTHLFTTTDNNGNPILRVPQNTGNLFVDYYLNENIYFGANVQYVDKRVDYGNIELDSYTTLNLSYNQKYKGFDISIQAKNVLDEDYETASGYSTEGRSLYGKIEYKF